MNWLKRSPSTRPGAVAVTSPSPTDVPTAYRPLHKYLRDRYASIVVLTLAEIEDLLGFGLPPAARAQLAWWVTSEAMPMPHCESWIEADRTAVPNLQNQTVVFERQSA